MIKRVLIADDVEEIRLLVSLMLDQEADFEVVGEAANGNEALEKVLELSPDVILLDMNMPERSGLDVLPELRQHAPSAAIVVFSGFEEGSLGSKARRLGASDYVEKGTSIPEIIQRIRALTS